MRIAIVVSHPIQHFCPMYASWAKNEKIKLKVYFASNIGAVAYHDNKFGKEIKWGNLYLDEFDHHFLNGNKTLAVNKHLDAPDLENQLNKFNPDLVIQYGRIYKFNKRLRKWAKKTIVKSAYISDSEDRHVENLLMRKLKHYYYSIFFKRIDFFLTVGDANEEFYKACKVASGKLIRMNFSIDLRLYEQYRKNKDQVRNEFRNRYKIPKDAIVISIVGKLVEMKNHLHLIKALKNLEQIQEQKLYYLIIAGSGPMFEVLKTESTVLIKNQVLFLDFVSPEKLPMVYCSSDLYIQPSEFERHSLAVSEAIYLGLPIIVPHTSGSYGATDDVQLGRNGLIYSLGNIQELTKRILEISGSEETLSHYKKHSFQISYLQQKKCHSDTIYAIIDKLNSKDLSNTKS